MADGQKVRSMLKGVAHLIEISLRGGREIWAKCLRNKE